MAREGISISTPSLFEPDTTLLPGQDNPAPSGPMSRPSCFLVSCGVRLSEVGLSEIRKPQVARSIRVACSTFQSLVLLVPITRVSGCGGGAGSSASFPSSRRLTKCRYSPLYISARTHLSSFESTHDRVALECISQERSSESTTRHRCGGDHENAPVAVLLVQALVERASEIAFFLSTTKG